MATIRDAGDSALLVELEERIDEKVNARAITIAAAIRDARFRGVRDVVSTYRSVAVYFDPLVAADNEMRAVVETACRAPVGERQGRHFDVPVAYGGTFGPDLAEVAAFAGLDEQAVVARHAGRSYRVFMVGFLPGFPYMGLVDTAIAAPRKATPRVRVAAGSVGIAGRQTGIYPRESPGGWQIIGRTPLSLFDPRRMPPALLAPGDTVRFQPDPAAAWAAVTSGGPEAFAALPTVEAQPRTGARNRCITVIHPGLFTTIQDLGRWGHQSLGVPVGGALDVVSHCAANAAVGNEAGAATLEVTLSGPELRFECDAWVAVAGADLGATLDSSPVPLHRPVRCRADSVLRFGERRRGTRAYIAVDGGIAVPPVLGSRATHAASGLGGIDGRRLTAGQRLPLGRPAGDSGRVVPPAVLPAPGDSVVLRVLPGPQDDFFPSDALAVLEQSRFVVSPQSDRMGYRLSGGRVPRHPGREMISDATFTGAIQVPLSGEPLLLMADRQTTGGYPQLAVVIAADLPLAAQVAPGDRVEFRVCSRSEALAALRAQQEVLGVFA
jgi:KipI family sensor histidine kinase inhibitor